MADLTIYGGVAVDFIHSGERTENSQIQRDDVIFGMKGASETDGGLIVGGEIKTEGDFAAPTLAYLNVGTEMATLWAGKFGNPADAADAADFSDTQNITHFPGEIDNAVALTVGANGVSAGLGVYQAKKASTSNALVTTTSPKATDTATGLVANTYIRTTAASDTDGTVAQIGYSAGGVSLNVGYHATGSTKTTGLKAGYTGEAFSVAAYQVSSDNLTVAAGSVSSGTYAEVTTTGVTGSSTMGATTLSAILAEDDAEADGSNDVFALKAAHKLGGGLSAYAEYSNVDGDFADDYQAYTVGASYMF